MYNETNKKKIIIFIVIPIIIIIITLAVFYYFRYYTADKPNLREPDNNLEQENTLSNFEIELDTNKKDCDLQYKNLLDINNFNFEKYCFNKTPENNDSSNNFSENNNIKIKDSIGLVIILDASGSMKSKINNKTKIDIAKKAAKDFLNTMKEEKNLSVSIIVYGHKGTNSLEDKEKSCNEIEEIYNFNTININNINNKIDSISAHGWTSIEGSLLRAKEILLKNESEENLILLISDGKESCDGKPVETIKNIMDNYNIKIQVDVIGFDVKKDEEKQLLEIAKAGNGKYYDAKNTIELKKAFEIRRKKIAEMNNKIFKTIEQLYNLSFIINRYNQCKIGLEEEKTVMKININDDEIITDNCVDEITTKYNSRYDNIENKIENIFKTSKKELIN